jgi:hypothetical protein
VETVTDEQQYWRIQLWLGDDLIEEHVAPAPLAEQYANVIRLRIHGVPGRRLHCEPVAEGEPSLDAQPANLGSTVADNHWRFTMKGI